ncbi:hypothetical protein [Pectobacterium sp. IFB5596]|uniref:hypothetical protein n=1 Tax=Pectobacterium sp. IFB5596 TaxID=1839803 RepID=UPI001F157B7E|nr:hypothetical protein [Pectobacterium sp. IFB5596]MCE9732079.1 hypothetical protein [Pectobacterium sp. IFB5596]
MAFNDILLSRIGTGVTIICAIGSIVGWWRSRQAATEAQSAVQQIHHQRHVRLAGNVQAALSSAIKLLRMVGPGCSAEKIVGIKMDPIIDETEQFLEQFQTTFSGSPLSEKINVSVDRFTAEIRAHISALSDAITPSDKLKESRIIYTKLSSLQPEINRVADDFTYNPKGN